MSTTSKRLAGCLLLSASLLLAIIQIYNTQIDGRILNFEFFDFPEGMLAFILTYLFIYNDVIEKPVRPVDFLFLAYFLLASAQLLHNLFPPPGLIYWLSILMIAISLLISRLRLQRTQFLVRLAVVAMLIAAIKYSVIPFVYDNENATWMTRVVNWLSASFVPFRIADYRPLSSYSQLTAFFSFVLFVAAVWLNYRRVVEGTTMPARIEVGRHLDRDRTLESGQGLPVAESESHRALVQSSPGNRRSLLKTIVAVPVGLISTLYVIAPTFGLIEILPDNLPFIGNIDEAVAVVLLMKVLDYFGVSVPLLSSRRRLTAEVARRKKSNTNID